MGMGDVKMSSF